MKVDRRANQCLNSKSCGVERAETEVEVVPTTRRIAGVFDQNSAVYHDAADTNSETDVSVLWITADRFHSWRTEETITAKHAKCDGKCLLMESSMRVGSIRK